MAIPIRLLLRWVSNLHYRSFSSSEYPRKSYFLCLKFAAKRKSQSSLADVVFFVFFLLLLGIVTRPFKEYVDGERRMAVRSRTRGVLKTRCEGRSESQNRPTTVRSTTLHSSCGFEERSIQTQRSSSTKNTLACRESQSRIVTNLGEVFLLRAKEPSRCLQALPCTSAMCPRNNLFSRRVNERARVAKEMTRVRKPK
jgi:hypothetical protein